MDASTAVLEAGNGFAPPLLGALWRAGIGGMLFAILVWAICRLVPRLPAVTRFWLWWMVSAKLLLGLAAGLTALPVASSFALRLPAQHPAAPAFFVARLVAQPTRLLYGGVRPRVIPPPTAPQAEAALNSARTADTDSGRKEATSAVIAPRTRSLTQTSGTHRPTVPWAGVARIGALLWCVGFLLCLVKIFRESGAILHTLRRAAPAPQSFQREARDVAGLLGMRRVPRILLHPTVPSPFLAGFVRPVIVLPDPAQNSLSITDLRMALAHELTHLRRGDLWLALIPSLAEAAFFFLPFARWVSRECTLCREEVCDSAAVTSLGTGVLSDYGQLLLKVTLAAESRRPSLQMGMAATTSPSFVHLRRRLTALKKAVDQPASPPLRRAAVLLVAICLPGMLPWHLRALPGSTASLLEDPGETAAALPIYSVTDLGTLGGKFSDAYDINEDGTAVGTANVFPLGGRGHAFLWRLKSSTTPNGQMTDLCAGSIYRHSLAYNINNRGQVAAAAFNNPLKPNAFLWTPGGSQRRYLGGLPGFRYSRATGINDEGTIVGTALGIGTDRRGAARMRAFSWQNGRIRDIGSLGGDFSSAAAISNSGHIVGKSDTASGDGGSTHAALWEAGTGKPRDIGTLSGGANSTANAVNNQGDVVGFSETFDAQRRAFLYTGGTLEDLGALPVPDPAVIPASVAAGINDAGLIVGSSSTLPLRADTTSRQEPPDSRAVLWLPVKDSQNKRRLIDLNQCLPSRSGWSLESARSINNRGEIVGVGRIDGKRHAFLLRPVKTAEEAPHGD